MLEQAEDISADSSRISELKLITLGTDQTEEVVRSAEKDGWEIIIARGVAVEKESQALGVSKTTRWRYI